MTERTYVTATGTYRESELAVVIWLNPNYRQTSHKRLLETFTSKENNSPIAFPIDSLQLKITEAIIATQENLHTTVLSSTQQKPIILPLPLAQQALGWTDFYIPNEFSEG